MSIANSLAKVNIPIYGIVGHPLGLTLHSHFLNEGYYPSITLMFTSPRYPPYPFHNCGRNFRIGTSERDGKHYSLLEDMLKELAQPMRNPFAWEGTITLEGKPFSGAIRYYAAPLLVSGFHFKSEKTFLSGVSYGPSCDEVIELLEGLQVLNGRDDVLKQYE